MGLILYSCANVEQESPFLACPYLVQEAEMPFCVGDGTAAPLPDELDDGDTVVLVVIVELLKGAVELLDTPVSLPSPPPRWSALAFDAVFETGGGT